MTQTTYDQPPDMYDDIRPSKPGMMPVPYRPDDSGTFRERRYQQIFEDHADYGLGAAFPDHDRHRAFDDSLGSLGSLGAETEPYGDISIFLFHSNRRGVRVSIQAPRKIFFIVVVVAIVVLAKPGLVDAIQLFLNSLQATH